MKSFVIAAVASLSLSTLAAPQALTVSTLQSYLAERINPIDSSIKGEGDTIPGRGFTPCLMSLESNNSNELVVKIKGLALTPVQVSLSSASTVDSVVLSDNAGRPYTRATYAITGEMDRDLVMELNSKGNIKSIAIAVYNIAVVKGQVVRTSQKPTSDSVRCAQFMASR